MFLYPFRKGAGPKKARFDQWELTVTPDPALFMRWTMTELHLLLNDLPASTSHPIPSSAMNRKETAAKNRKTFRKRKTFRFRFWEICSHHWTCWCHGRLISNCIFKKNINVPPQKHIHLLLLTISCKEIPTAAFNLVITVLSDTHSLFYSLDIRLFLSLFQYKQ